MFYNLPGLSKNLAVLPARDAKSDKCRMKQSELFRDHPEYRHPKPPPKKLKLTGPDPKESAILSSVLQALNFYPSVVKAWRQNTGAGKFQYPDGSTSQFIKFGFPGLSDIGGFMRDGRALFIEIKTEKGKVTPNQQAFLAEASKAGCVAFVARSVEDLKQHLC